ncbi:MAG TPA: exonuclease SbcCD subunit D [Ktedonobacterales bacterium]|jgi:DNA repair exonuclease SbcCD nuclease subunit
MRATFVHTADNHLGYEQYGFKARFNDFALAFYSVIDDAIARKADLVIIAGDLFNKRAIDALTLIQAEAGLQKLKDAGIPAIAIEGNHDRSYYRDGYSWLQFLCWQGLLILLNPLVQDGAPELTPWDQQTMRGAYVDLMGGRLRVYGLPWYGASTARIMESFAERLAEARERETAEGVEYRLLLMHTGVEGIVPQLHGLPTRAQFEPLRGLIDYVALGHVHKQYALEDWLYNPGSTETWGAEESAWERGYYVVTIDTERQGDGPHHTAQHVVNPRRPFLRFTFSVDGLTTPAAFYEQFARFCRQRARESGDALDREPVVDVGLMGVLAFDAASLERPRLEEYVKEYFKPLVARIHDNTRDTDFDPFESEGMDGRDRASWAQLEVHIFQELLARDARYLPQASRWARVLAQVKQMALGGEDPAAITQRLREARAELWGAS